MKRKKNRKLHGSVLLTVVVVMSLLIVFLFGTLTLATAANNRAHVNYSSAQTNITSRTVVDAAVKAMIQDPDYAKYVMDNADTSEVNIPVQISAKHNGKYGTVVGRGDQSTVSVRKEGTKKFYDDSKKEWVDADVLKFTATVRLGGVDTTTSAYVVNPPSIPGSSAPGGGGFSTAAGAKLECQTNIFGGSYLNMPKEEVSKLFNYKYRDDYSNKADTSNYRQFPEYNPSDSNSYLKLVNLDGVIEDDVYIYNNLYITQWSSFIFGKGQGLTVWGDLVTDNQASSLKYSTTMDYTLDAEGKKNYGNIKFTDIPYVYVDGAIKGNGIILGNESNIFPLNIFCGKIEANNFNSNEFELAGDLYCMNENETSIIHAKKTEPLYSWTGSVIYGGDSSPKAHSNGSINTKGSLSLKGIDMTGEVRVEKNCTLDYAERHNGNYPVKIDGDLYVKGRLDVYSSPNAHDDDTPKDLLSKFVTGTIYCNDVYVDGVKYEPEKEEENIEFKVPNETRQYYQFIPSESQDNGGGTFVWKDAFGDFTLDSYEPVYYRWNDTFEPAGAGLYPAITNPDEANTYLRREANWPKKIGELPPTTDGNSDFYYVQTDVNRAGITKDSLDENNVLKLNPGETVRSQYGVFHPFDWYSIPCNDSGDGSTEPYTIKNMLITGDSIKADSKVQNLESTVVVYPPYAERHTILGLEKDEDGNIPEIEGYDAKSKPEGQIVKTVEDIPAGVFNIYDNEALAPDLQAKYDVLLNNTPADTSDDVNVLKEPKDTIKLADMNYVSYFNSDETDHTVKYDITSCTEAQAADGNFINNNARGIYINKDCIIDGWVYGNNAKKFVFNPGTDKILVVVRNFATQSGMEIYVDDSQGGTVYFYVEPNTTWNINGVPIITTSYKELFNKQKVLKYDSPDTTGVMDLTDYADTGLTEQTISPNVYIYGGTDSKLTADQFPCMTAYILSPNLDVSISAGSDIYGLQHFYYHDVDIKNPPGISGATARPFIIGALNAKTATLPNTLNIVYIPQNKDSDDDPDPDGTGGSGRYNVMYYSEF